jgi:predicted nuclease of predicted toxin-antitoxin system
LSIALYMDENVPRAISAGLRLRGIDVLTPQEDGRRGISDPLLLDRATELGRPLFSQDEDLLAEARRRQSAGIFFAGVLYAHQLHITIGDCVRDLHLIAEASEPRDLANCVEFLPL